mmetsp:Transcript_14958/g.41355  ORF Transcript_14958/g.41355 Transcript_14958/m.41355 type:complete len:233 (-) Transcript_14958:231-929(-)
MLPFPNLQPFGRTIPHIGSPRKSVELEYWPFFMGRTRFPVGFGAKPVRLCQCPPLIVAGALAARHAAKGYTIARRSPCCCCHMQIRKIVPKPMHLGWLQKQADQQAVDGQVAHAVGENEVGSINVTQQVVLRTFQKPRHLGDEPIGVKSHVLLGAPGGAAGGVGKPCRWLSSWRWHFEGFEIFLDQSLQDKLQGFVNQLSKAVARLGLAQHVKDVPPGCRRAVGRRRQYGGR